MNIFQASSQWSTRPADERFASLEDLLTETKRYAKEAREAKVPFSDIRVENVGGDVQLVGKANVPAKFTNWAFGQLCSRIGAPASYLRELPATLAAQNLNHGLAARAKNLLANSTANLMFHQNGSLLLRSILTDDYARIWNWEVAERLVDLKGRGWDGAKPTMHFNEEIPVGTCIRCEGSGKTEEDTACVPCNGTGKEMPALYASDHDMFAFLINKDRVVEERGAAGMIYKGVIISNSEVGASALKIKKFLFREMCGNHIIWDASEVVDVSVRHVGGARGKWSAYFAAIHKYANESVSDLEAKIAASKVKLIGATKEEVLDALFGKRGIGISRKTLEASYDAVNREQDGDPNSVWGFVQGVTRHSQTLEHTDKRTELDAAAGKIMDTWF